MNGLLNAREGRRLALAFLLALGLHLGALALVTFWRSASPAFPGDQRITVDLAPQTTEAPTLVAVETSQPAGAPSEVASVQPPVEFVTAEAVPVETAPIEATVAELPVQSTAWGRVGSVAPPPEAAQPVARAPAEVTAVAAPTVVAAPPAIVEVALPPDARPIESIAIEALPVPAAVVPPPDPEVVTAEPPSAAAEAATPPRPRRPSTPQPVERRPVAKPEPVRPPPPREAVRRERQPPARAAAQPGARGEAQREASRGAASRLNTGGSAAAAVDPSAMSRWTAQIAGALKARLRYPDSLRNAGVAGSATLRFTLHRSGRVLSAAIVASAGHPALDAAALATTGFSLPAAPDGVPQQQLTISVPLRFQVR